MQCVALKISNVCNEKRLQLVKVYIVQLIKHNRSLRRQTNKKLNANIDKKIAHGKSCMLEIACTHECILKDIFTCVEKRKYA